jgi:hypothetical protein
MLLGIKADNFRTVIPSISRPVCSSTNNGTSYFTVYHFNNEECIMLACFIVALL